MSWFDARVDFIDYLKVKEYDARVAGDIVGYLDKYSPVLIGPLDVIQLFSKVTVKTHICSEKCLQEYFKPIEGVSHLNCSFLFQSLKPIYIQKS